jgi:hypothetical protein
VAPVQMKTQMVLRGLTDAAILLGGIAFMVLAAHKLATLDRFAAAITSHGLIPGEMARWVGGGFALAELSLGALAVHDVAGPRTRFRSLTGFGILLAFLTAYSLALVLEPPKAPVNCGCGWRPAEVASWIPLCIQNATLCVVSCAGAVVLGRGEGRGVVA